MSTAETTQQTRPKGLSLLKAEKFSAYANGEIDLHTLVENIQQIEPPKHKTSLFYQLGVLFVAIIAAFFIPPFMNQQGNS